MARQENIFEQIEAYLAGEMGEAERSDFEQQLTLDAALKAELDLQRDAHALLALQGQLAYKEKLKAFDASLAAPQGAAVRPLWKRLPVQVLAASVVVFISLYMWLSTTYSTEAIISGAFQPYDDVLTMKGAERSSLDEAMFRYNQRDYPAAIQAFETILQETPGDEGVQFYLGVSLLGKGDYPAARTYLEISKRSPRFGEAAAWYDLLACIQSQGLEACREELRLLTENPQHSKHAAAKALEKDLSNTWRKYNIVK